MCTPVLTVTNAYHEYADRLLAAVKQRYYSRLDEAACEDVVSDVFRQLFEDLQGGSLDFDTRSAYGLLWYWAKQKATNELRRRGRQAQPGLLAVERADGDSVDPSQVQLDREKSQRRRNALESALRDFTRDCEWHARHHEKAVFEARVVLGWTPDEVAKYLGIAKKRVFSLAFKTRRWVVRRLRTCYDSRGSLFASRYRTADKDIPYQTGSTVTKHDAPGTLASHVDETSLQSYLDGGLDDAKRRTVEGHLRQCDGCSRLLASLDELDRRAREELDLVRVALGALCPLPSRLGRLACHEPMGPAERLELLLHVVQGKCGRCRRRLERDYGVALHGLGAHPPHGA